MRCAVLFSVLLSFLSCHELAPNAQRGVKIDTTVTEPIDWTQSAAVFIGIETFVAEGAPPDVRYAADDATDLAWLFAKELPSLLPSDRIDLLLSGRPHKRVSLEHLLVLQREGSVVGTGIGADAIYAHIRESATNVGPDGVFILTIATHGYTTDGGHVLLTPDATTSNLKSVVLNRMLDAIPPGHGRRVLLFVDACRKPYAPAPARQFEDLQFPGDYAIFAASEPGGYARANDAIQNGNFTSAVLAGLAGGAAPDIDGYITPSTLGTFVSGHVRSSSGGEQRPEARFGGLENLPLFRARPVGRVASILAPLPDAAVKPSDMVDVGVNVPGLYVTVFVCSATTSRCWKQNAQPIAAAANETTHVGVQYGDTDVFRLHVALTADDGFLRGETAFRSIPISRRANRIVYWLNSVTVNREEK
jgi:hypothetical protein